MTPPPKGCPKINKREKLAAATSAFLRDHAREDGWTAARKLASTMYRLEQLRQEHEKPKTKPALPSFVYVIGSAGYPVKIGVAADVSRRVDALQTGFPHPLRIYFQVEVDEARKIERLAHSALSAKRLHGEWFDCEPTEAIAVIQGIIPKTDKA